MRKLSRDIVWPILGGLLGFLFFFLFILGSPLILPAHLADKAFDLISIIIATFVAAAAGGWAAFSAEQLRRDRQERNLKISAANKAIFSIAQAHTMLENLRQHYIEKNNARNDPDPLKVNSPQPGMLRDVGFDFDELSFFLDQPGDVSAQVLMELVLFEWQIQVLVQTVELRATAIEELHRAINEKPVANLDLSTVKVLFSVHYKKVEALTNQFIQVVDEGITNIQEVYKKFQKSLQHQFPGQEFLKLSSLERNSMG